MTQKKEWRRKENMTEKMKKNNIIRFEQTNNLPPMHMKILQTKSKLCGAFNKSPDFFVQAFKIVVDS